MQSIIGNHYFADQLIPFLLHSIIILLALSLIWFLIIDHLFFGVLAGPSWSIPGPGAAQW